MESFENMNKKTKIILSIVGVSAVLIPAALLMFVSQNTQVSPQANDNPRQIDKIDVGDKKNIPTSRPVSVPTPSPVIATPPPVKSGLESTPASQ